MFTVRQMRYFEALIETGLFSKAAASARISQPALSVQIAEMEKTASVPLFKRGSFNRSNNPVRLTNIGIEYHQQIKKVLAEIDKFQEIKKQTIRNESSPE